MREDIVIGCHAAHYMEACTSIREMRLQIALNSYERAIAQGAFQMKGQLSGEELFIKGKCLYLCPGREDSPRRYRIFREKEGKGSKGNYKEQKGTTGAKKVPRRGLKSSSMQ